MLEWVNKLKRAEQMSHWPRPADQTSIILLCMFTIHG